MKSTVILLFVCITVIDLNSVDACAGKMKVAKKKCLHSSSKILLENGQFREAKNLQIGDKVQAYDVGGPEGLLWSRVIRMENNEPNSRRTFVRWTTRDGRHVTVTEEHGLLVKQCGNANVTWSKMAATLATVGMCVPTVEGESVLVKKEVFTDKGIVQPITESGTVVIDGFVVTCFDSADAVIGGEKSNFIYYCSSVAAIFVFLVLYAKKL